jgi:hypothetical protein
MNRKGRLHRRSKYRHHRYRSKYPTAIRRADPEREVSYRPRRHMAQMMVAYYGRDTVAMVGRIIHIPAAVEPASGQTDQTGCGDQTMAVLFSEIVSDTDITEACRMVMIAGAMQDSRIGIKPTVNTVWSGFLPEYCP